MACFVQLTVTRPKNKGGSKFSQLRSKSYIAFGIFTGKNLNVSIETIVTD